MLDYIELGTLDSESLNTILSETSYFFENKQKYFKPSRIVSKSNPTNINIRKSFSCYPKSNQIVETNEIGFDLLYSFLNKIKGLSENVFKQIVVADIQLLIYESGGFYDWHEDYLPTKSTNEEDLVRIFSMSIQLNQDYVAGDLKIMTGPGTEIQVQKLPGSYVIFNSMHRHTATPVIGNNNRRVVTFWFKGSKRLSNRINFPYTTF